VIVSPTWAVMFGGLKARTPVPPTTILWSRLEGTELVDVGAVDDVAVGGAEAEAEAEAGVLPVAAAWKAANLSPGLIAKTMPALQWVPCRQYAQIGVVRCTVSSATGKLLVTASATGMLQINKKSPRCSSHSFIKNEIGLQSRIETSGKRRTRALQGRLRDGMVFLAENKSYDIPYIRVLTS